jgi:GNAT superfamily N-acetyltransferase
MPYHVIPAVGEVLERVLDDTFPLWHDGLSRANYARLWAGQLKTPWGAAHLDRVALVDGPHVVSSAKRYDLSLRLDGRIRRVLGIGAVFTAGAHRGRGAARELIARMLETAVTEGQEFAMLFSEIPPAFYERLEFVPVPLAEWTLEVDQKRGGAPAMLVRSGDDRDLPNVVEMSAARSAGARLALDRSEDFIRFGITKKRLHSGLVPSGVRNTEFLVAEEGHQAVAYLVSTEQDGRWVIEEAGDRDPAGARLGAMLQVMLARSPSERLPEIRCWWPQSLMPQQLKVAASTPTQEVLMIRPLRDRMLPLPPLAAAEVVYWHADYF